MADDSKSGLEDLVKDDVQDGAGDDGKMAQDQPGSGDSQKSKGTWITALPQDVREGIKAEEYANLGEYVRDLQSKAAAGGVHDEKAFTDGWDSFAEEMRKKNIADALPDSVQQVLKDSKVDAATARKIYDALFQYGISQVDKQNAESEAEMREFIRAEWGDAFRENNEAVKRGLRYFGKDHPKLMEKADRRKSIYTPEFVQLLADYSRLKDRLQGEQNAPEGTPQKKEDSDNPYGLKNI